VTVSFIGGGKPKYSEKITDVSQLSGKYTPPPNSDN